MRPDRDVSPMGCRVRGLDAARGGTETVNPAGTRRLEQRGGGKGTSTKGREEESRRKGKGVKEGWGGVGCAG